ncbi:Superkiller protein 3 [Dimargaris xerosporica]|nr:Superkiller protein 3 [Dimargaris xerosporica]
MASKARLKQIKEALGAKDFEKAYRSAKSILQFEAANYNALIFLGVACHNLEKWDECEAAYKEALQVDDSQPLAWQGLLVLYDKTNNHEQYLALSDRLCQTFEQSNNGDKLLQTLQKRLEIRQQQSSPLQTIEAWKDLASTGRWGAPLKRASHPRPSDMEIWEHVISLQTAFDDKTLAQEVDTRRSRLGADPLVILRIKVEREVIAQSQLDHYFEQWFESTTHASHEVDEQTMHQMHRQYFHRIYQKLKLLDDKESLQTKVSQEASFLVQRAICAEAFEFTIESMDYATWFEFPSTLLTTYIEQFPNACLVPTCRAILLLCQGTTDDTLAQAMEQLSVAADAKSDTQPLTQMVYTWLAVQRQEWHDAVAYGRRMLELQTQLATDLGRSFPKATAWGRLCVANALRAQGSDMYAQATDVYQSLLTDEPDNADAQLGLALIHSATDALDQARVLLENLTKNQPTHHRALAELAWVRFQQSDVTSAKTLIDQALDLVTVPDALYVYRLGRIYWAMGDQFRTDKAFAFTCFLRAAKHDPRMGAAFTWLGHYYSQVSRTPKPAAKCYQRAVLLDATNIPAAKYLVQFYFEHGEGVHAKNVLQTVLEVRPREAWAWQRLGFYHLQARAWSDATQAFQQALKLDSQNSTNWKGLGEAYFHDGRYVAAAKAFQRLLDVDPDSVLTLYSIGRVHAKMGTFQEALAHYQRAWEALHRLTAWQQLPYIPVVLAAYIEAHLGLANEYSYLGYYGRARHQCNYGLTLVDQLLMLPGTAHARCAGNLLFRLCQLYQKVLGNCQTLPMATIGAIVTQLQPKLDLAQVHTLEKPLLEAFMADPQTFAIPTEWLGTPPTTVSQSAVTLCALALMALRYQLAMAQPDSIDPAVRATVLYDLATTYYLCLLFTCESTTATVHNPLNDGQNPWLIEAIRLGKEAALAQPYHVGYWNALGCMTVWVDPEFAQHAFVRALDLNDKNATVWANLGYLYLIHDDLELANRAFTQAQTANPECMTSWLGQGLVAQHLTQPQEAQDLFQHTLYLSHGSHAESNWLFASQYFLARHQRSKGHRDNTTEMLTLAVFAMRKYVAQRPTDPCGHNLLGILLEECQQYAGAVQSLGTAVELVPTSGKLSLAVADDGLASVPLDCVVAANYARLLNAVDDYPAAQQVYQSVIAKLDMDLAVHRDLSRYNVCHFLGLGLAQYFNHDLEASLHTFGQALALAEADVELYQDTSVLLAQVLWALGTPEHCTLAKEQLLASIAMASTVAESTPDTAGVVPVANVNVLAALAALGIRESDDAVLAATLSEMAKFTSEQDTHQLLPFLTSRLGLLQEHSSAVRRAIATAVHVWPTRGALWTALADAGRLQANQLGSLTFDSWAMLHQAAQAGLHGSVTQDCAHIAAHAYMTLAAVAQSAPSPNGTEYAQVWICLYSAKGAAQKAVNLAPWDPQAWLRLCQVDLSEALLLVRLDPTTKRVTPSRLDGVLATLEWLSSCPSPRVAPGTSTVWNALSQGPRAQADWVQLLRALALLLKGLAVQNDASAAMTQLVTLSYQTAEALAVRPPTDGGGTTPPLLCAAAYLHMAHCLAIHGDLGNAAASYQAVIDFGQQEGTLTDKLHPLLVTALVELASLHSRQGDYNAACRALQQVLALARAHHQPALAQYGHTQLRHLALVFQQPPPASPPADGQAAAPFAIGLDTLFSSLAEHQAGRMELAKAHLTPSPASAEVADTETGGDAVLNGDAFAVSMSTPFAKAYLTLWLGTADEFGPHSLERPTPSLQPALAHLRRALAPMWLRSLLGPSAIAGAPRRSPEPSTPTAEL